MDKINRLAVLSLLFARVIYAINWFNIASIFSHIASDFKQDVSSLGLLTTSFLIGIGLFQVPGGILAAVQGSRRTAIYGITIASSAALLCGLSSQLQQMEVLRFVVGLGMALFFSPCVTLITRYLGREFEGFAVGMLNSAHSIGGIIGLFGWVILVELAGWKQSFLLSGGLGLISSLLLVAFLPRKEEQQHHHQQSQQNAIGKHFEIKISDIRNVLFDRSLFVIGLVLLGAQIAWGLPLTFIVFYLEDYLKVGSSTAGFIASLGLIGGLMSAPVFGRIYDKIRNIKKLLFVCGLVMSGGVAGIAVTNTSSSIAAVYTAGISNVLVGVFSAGVFTIAYTSAKEVYRKNRTGIRKEGNIEATITERSMINRMQSSYDTLAISWVNGLSLSGAFWVPVVFSFVVHHIGYAIAWVLGGIFSLLFILPSLGITAYKGKK
ncbi:MAG TPA: MFS transporter [Nitrososphaeraceae archaeon]|nr:MFS transporter [Nitrososphaeraceae archaeon]